jgi:hypothetical protein
MIRRQYQTYIKVAGQWQYLYRKRHLLTTLPSGSLRATLAGWFPARELDQAA